MYSNYTFEYEKASKGHLPSGGEKLVEGGGSDGERVVVGVWCGGRRWRLSLFSRVKTCRL
jgi:hypothetical protein